MLTNVCWGSSDFKTKIQKWDVICFFIHTQLSIYYGLQCFASRPLYVLFPLQEPLFPTPPMCFSTSLTSHVTSSEKTALPSPSRAATALFHPVRALILHRALLTGTGAPTLTTRSLCWYLDDVPSMPIEHTRHGTKWTRIQRRKTRS